MARDNYKAKDHWRCLAACFLLSLSPFQYGIDFGLIGGFQAMVGFLRVRQHPGLPINAKKCRSLATKTPIHL